MMGGGEYTEDPGGKPRPAESNPDSPYVKPDLDKGKGPVQSKNPTRPNAGADGESSPEDD
jgi:hypothetical protein